MGSSSESSSQSSLVTRILTLLRPRIIALVSEAFAAQKAAAELAEQERLEAIRLEEQRLEAIRLEEQRLEAIRLGEQRLEAIRLEEERQQQLLLQQHLLLQQQSEAGGSLSSLFGSGHEVKVEVPGSFLEEYNISGRK